MDFSVIDNEICWVAQLPPKIRTKICAEFDIVDKTIINYATKKVSDYRLAYNIIAFAKANFKEELLVAEFEYYRGINMDVSKDI